MPASPRSQKSHHFLRAILLIGCMSGSFAGGLWYDRALASVVVPVKGASVTGFGQSSSEVGKNLDFAQFWRTWQYISERYVDQPVAESDLYYGSLQGLVSGLKDPYSVYFSPEEAAEFSDKLQGSFSGIGAEIGIDKEGYLAIVAPLKGSPAEKAGLVSGDRIIGIDKIDTSGMTVTDAVKHIRGEKGSTVSLTVYREGEQQPRDFSVVRDDITIDSVVWKVRDDHVGVISISMFNENTVPLFEKAAAEMVAANVKGIVIDLRNNPGGFLEGAKAIAGYWIDGQTAVIEEVRGSQTEQAAHGPNSLQGIKTVVLVNGGSASASEILAGALQDDKKAILVGTQTFGKGSVQEYQEFPDGSSMKLTVARWLTPLGRSIDKQGIAPDEVVKESNQNDPHDLKDSQFDEAIRLITTP